MLNLSAFSGNIKHHNAWERHSIKECFVSGWCDVKFLLYCHKKLIPIKTTKSLQDVLKASNPSNTN